MSDTKLLTLQGLPMLYHYTSLDGLLGIVNGNSVWASHCKYLNDSLEYIHALEFPVSLSNNIYMDDDYLSPFGFSIRKALDEMVHNNVYVSSFSEKPDLLSQWRGYCPPGRGVCIGFKRDVLEKYCHENELNLYKCVYSEVEQRQKMKKLIDQCEVEFPMPTVTRAEYDKFESKDRVNHEIDYHQYVIKGAGKNQADKALSNLCNSIAKLAPLFKDSGFHEESEWRIIAENPTSDIQFRSGISHLIPYITLPILSFSKDAIGEVIIGPNASSHSCISSVSMLLESNGLKDVNVRRSKIPFKSW
ncbi:DUF2971 domain-containing protein [Pseudoalteromonas sp. NZS127_1]|uniref:DUF2971 domain-containing protein n=1 Tax=Pseudoalteromonas sp. NZS127_1 TaxID=2792074 RepID=UPI0018CCEBF5|nr:DUF2971 domain-containing protein [Pseudoalteromonas sp. NZS127_1]MBG9993616.1 DUF2971 domain-containing protein [Pseudoalteromonas sp. NZS127_1]